MSSWEQFFARHRDYAVEVTFYGCKDHFTLDELYAAFKARMLAEAAESAPETEVIAKYECAYCKRKYATAEVRNDHQDQCDPRNALVR